MHNHNIDNNEIIITMSTEDRQKQIDIIARSFSMQSHAGDPRSFSEGIELGFKAGAAWADRNPANKWHDVSDEPKPHIPTF